MPWLLYSAKTPSVMMYSLLDPAPGFGAVVGASRRVPMAPTTSVPYSAARPPGLRLISYRWHSGSQRIQSVMTMCITIKAPVLALVALAASRAVAGMVPLGLTKLRETA